MKIKSKYYGGYGSNLDRSQMAVRCPASRVVCGVILFDWQLVFRGVADIVHRPGNKVPFGVYEITDQCEKALDHYEGFPDLYIKKHIDVSINGSTERVLTYVMTNNKGIGPPFEGYFNVMRQGYDDWGFGYQPLCNALEYSIRNKKSIKSNKLKRLFMYLILIICHHIPWKMFLH